MPVPIAVAALSYAGTFTVTVNADRAVRDVALLTAGIGIALGERPARPAGTFDPVNGPQQRGSSVIGHHEGEPQ